VDFRDAIAAANELLAQCDQQQSQLSEQQLRPFLASEEAVRGFFVAFLPGEFRCTNVVPQALVNVLRENPAADSVIVRNLVMSSATEAAHRRSGDQEKAQGSARVSARTADLIATVDSPSLWHTLADMRHTLLGHTVVFVEFFKRMNYGDDEKLAALSAVDKTLSRRTSNGQSSLDMNEPID
jgi:hypothetical protein